MKTDNKQQLLFIQSMFNDIKGVTQDKPISISVTDKHEKIPYSIEVYNNTTGSFLAYRIIDKDDNPSVWSTWDSVEHVENWFKTASLI